MIVEPDDQDRYNGNFNKTRDATPYPAITRTGSIVPPLDGEDIAVPQSLGPSRPSVDQPPKVQATTDPPPSLTLRDDLFQPFQSRYIFSTPDHCFHTSFRLRGQNSGAIPLGGMANGVC